MEMGSISNTCRYTVVWIKISNGRPLSLDPIASVRPKNSGDVDKWSSMRLCHSVRGM